MISRHALRSAGVSLPSVGGSDARAAVGGVGEGLPAVVVSALTAAASFALPRPAFSCVAHATAKSAASKSTNDSAVVFVIFFATNIIRSEPAPPKM